MAAATEPEDVKIILLGGRWAGKSSCGNTILKSEVFKTSKQTEVCSMEKNMVSDMLVTVVDTPSWNWVPAEDSSDELKQELKRSVEMLGEGPHAFLVVYPLGAPFSKRHKIAVQEHLELLGDDVWNHTMILFSKGDWLGGQGIEPYIQEAKEELKWLLEQCNNRYHVLNNKDSKDDPQVSNLLEKIIRMIWGQRKRKSITPPPATFSKETSTSAEHGETSQTFKKQK